MFTGSWTLDWFFVLAAIQIGLPIMLWIKRESTGVKGIGEA
ncbi:hypothetical protein GCM10023116_11190 [Kistimonas scapharcae]|uniref:Uncharacterized protein n=1 Tax=Kistimonas scapharcae TaxID=1036133 RepID=A0ABP8V172_9GAMM